jgi:ribosomal-protein-alanine N-acetyltransferase
MTPGDLPEVLAIEEQAFADPWTQAHFEGELKNRHGHIDLLRAEQGELLGYIVYWTVVDEAQILDVAVATTHTRQGYGRALVEHALDTARRLGCRSALLEVGRSNRAAITLYEALGFQPTTVRKGYYAHNGEDALLMRRALEIAA